MKQYVLCIAMMILVSLIWPNHHVGVVAVDVQDQLSSRASVGSKGTAEVSTGTFSRLLHTKTPMTRRESSFVKASMNRKNKKTQKKIKQKQRKLKKKLMLCNGQDICNRKYGEVTFPATHNSYAVDCMGDKGTDYVDFCHWANMAAGAGSLNILDVTTNHEKGLRSQWKRGIRGFLIDTYEVGPNKDTISKAKARVGLSPQASAIKLCHADCALGQVDAIKWFKELKRLMASSPNDIVTLWIEDGKVKRHQTREVLRKAGFKKWWDVHKKVTSKPSQSIRSQKIADLISDGNQLVVAFQSGKGAQQNSWVLRNQGDLHKQARCKLGGGNISPNNLYVMNQFMSIHAGTPSRDMSILANMKANVHKRLCMCEGYAGVKPSLVTVDHFQVGDVVGATKEFNKNGCPEGLEWDGWKDGTMCALGTTCHRCKNEASFWGYQKGFPMTKCGRIKEGECERTKWYKTCGSHGECRPKKSNPCKGKCVCDKVRINECKCVMPSKTTTKLKKVNVLRVRTLNNGRKFPIRKIAKRRQGVRKRVRRQAKRFATKVKRAGTSVTRKMRKFFRL
jgi:hypothetical protein